MANILVVEDDPEVRLLIQLHLESAGHAVAAACDGADALRRMAERRPDLIVTDLDMPNLDGFGLLQAVRADNQLAPVPLIFLTAAGGDAFRRGMSLGADDFVHKPVSRAILLEAVAGRLRRSLTAAAGRVPAAGADATAPDRTVPVAARRRRPAALSPDRTLAMPADEILRTAPPGEISRVLVHGSVLFVDIRNFTAYAESIPPHEVVELLSAFFDRASEPVRQQRGWVVNFLGDGFIAMFEPASNGPDDHAERALKAALLIVHAANRFQGWVRRRFAGAALPPFAIGVGVHSGEVVICRMGSDEGAETTAIGDTVNVAARLESTTKSFGWSVCASRSALEAAGPRFLTGRDASPVLKGKSTPVDAVEITGLAPRPGSTPSELSFYTLLEESVAANSATVEAGRRRTGAAAPGEGA